MFSAFRMGAAASGRGLCDINGVLFRVAKLQLRKCSRRLIWSMTIGHHIMVSSFLFILINLLLLTPESNK